MIDLFDMQRRLKRGRWKIPLYFKPVNTGIYIDEIKELKRLDGVWVYLRVLFPEDEEFMLDANRAPDISRVDHQIPTIH